MMPTMLEIEIPLLSALEKLGGSGRPKQVYESITKSFPELTEADLSEKLQRGESKWTNRIQWGRQRLIESGDMTSPNYGVWAITPKRLFESP